MRTVAATATARDADEAALALRVLSAMLREDIVGLRTAATPVELPDGPWLRLTPASPAGALLLPVADDGFQCAQAPPGCHCCAARRTAPN